MRQQLRLLLLAQRPHLPLHRLRQRLEQLQVPGGEGCGDAEGEGVAEQLLDAGGVVLGGVPNLCAAAG